MGTKLFLFLDWLYAIPNIYPDTTYVKTCTLLYDQEAKRRTNRGETQFGFRNNICARESKKNMVERIIDQNKSVHVTCLQIKKNSNIFYYYLVRYSYECIRLFSKFVWF